MITLILDFIKRSQEHNECMLEFARKIQGFAERMEARVGSIEEQLVALANQDSFDRSVEEILEAADDDGEEEDEDLSDDNRDKWKIRFEQLREYKIKNGHCNVPQLFKANRPLGIWVKNQRAHYSNKIPKLSPEKIPKTPKLSPEKIARLDCLEFYWGKGLPTQTWDFMFEHVQKFQRENGHCNIPFNQENPSALAVWTAFQRTEKKEKNKNKPTLLTAYQDWKLQEIGFNWDGPSL